MPQYVQQKPPAPYVRQSALLVTGTVTEASTLIVRAGACRHLLVIGNPSGTNVWINPAGEPAVVGQGALCLPGTEYILDPAPTEAVYAISESGTVLLYANGC